MNSASGRKIYLRRFERDPKLATGLLITIETRPIALKKLMHCDERMIAEEIYFRHQLAQQSFV